MDIRSGSISLIVLAAVWLVGTGGPRSACAQSTASDPPAGAAPETEAPAGAETDRDDPRRHVSSGAIRWSDGSVGKKEEGESEEEAEAQNEPTLDLSVGGALRFNVLFEGFDRDNRLKEGEFTFDTFRLNADGTYGDLFFAAEYRFYTGYRFLKEGYVGYNVTDDLSATFGVHQVPFGIQPYHSNSWFFNLQYYAGFEDDVDAGVKVAYEPGPWSLKAAYYMNAEQTGFAGGTGLARYSFDVVPVDSAALGYAGIDGDRQNQEVDQFNLKVTYTLDHGSLGQTTIGASGQSGGLYNRSMQETDRGASGMAHLEGRYGRFTVRLSAARYSWNPVLPDGQSDDFVAMGAYDAPYKVASEGAFYGAGLSYRQPVSAGPISALTFYEDVSHFDKGPEGWTDATSFITGILTEAGPIYAYTDFLVTRNHPFSIPGADFGSALAEGSDDWHVSFNMNLGIYF